MNGYVWSIKFVSPSNDYLIDRTNTRTVATTDPQNLTIWLSEDLHGDFLIRVLIHELGHCALFSFGLLNSLHKMSDKKYWVEIEEWACNFIADYGNTIFNIARDFMGRSAINIIPEAIERYVG